MKEASDIVSYRAIRFESRAVHFVSKGDEAVVQDLITRLDVDDVTSRFLGEVNIDCASLALIPTGESAEKVACELIDVGGDEKVDDIFVEKTPELSFDACGGGHLVQLQLSA